MIHHIVASFAEFFCNKLPAALWLPFLGWARSAQRIEAMACHVRIRCKSRWWGGSASNALGRRQCLHESLVGGRQFRNGLGQHGDAGRVLVERF